MRQEDVVKCVKETLLDSKIGEFLKNLPESSWKKLSKDVYMLLAEYGFDLDDEIKGGNDANGNA